MRAGDATRRPRSDHRQDRSRRPSTTSTRSSPRSTPSWSPARPRVECPLEDVPFLQKRIIEKRLNANRSSSPPRCWSRWSPTPRPGPRSATSNAVPDGAGRRDAVPGRPAWGLPGPHGRDDGAGSSATEAPSPWRTQFRGGRHRSIDWGPPHPGRGHRQGPRPEVAQRVGAKYVVAFTTSGDSAKPMSPGQPRSRSSRSPLTPRSARSWP